MGYYSNSTRSSSCSACAAGQYQSQYGRVACIKCSTGKAQGATGQVSCVACAANYHAPDVGRETCEECSLHYSSVKGSSNCTLAAVGYYIDPKTESSKSCPSDTECKCRGGSYLPIPSDHHYIQRFSPQYAGEVHRCFHKTCIGLKTGLDSCWSMDYFNRSWLVAQGLESVCTSTSLQCSTGSYGPLCGACKKDYIYSSTHQECIRCGQWGNIQLVTLCLGFVLVFLLSIAFMSNSSNVDKYWLTGMLKRMDGGMLRVLWVNYQVFFL